jgi:hypothetical protein
MKAVYNIYIDGAKKASGETEASARSLFDLYRGERSLQQFLADLEDVERETRKERADRTEHRRQTDLFFGGLEKKAADDHRAGADDYETSADIQVDLALFDYAQPGDTVRKAAKYLDGVKARNKDEEREKRREAKKKETGGADDEPDTGTELARPNALVIASQNIGPQIMRRYAGMQYTTRNAGFPLPRLPMPDALAPFLQQEEPQHPAHRAIMGLLEAPEANGPHG